MGKEVAFPFLSRSSGPREVTQSPARPSVTDRRRRSLRLLKPDKEKAWIASRLSTGYFGTLQVHDEQEERRLATQD
jgi:hypothetical protein